MAGYVRQSAGQIVTNNTIQASDFNNEYNQLQSAFSGITGHDHSGGTGLGPQLDLTAAVAGILPAANGGTGLNTTSSTGLAQVNAGAWSISTILPTGTSATTPPPLTSSTTVATTAYVDAAVTVGGIGIDIAGLTGVLQITSGIASVSTALANGTTAITQALSDSSTNIATTSYVNAAIAVGAAQTVGLYIGGNAGGSPNAIDLTIANFTLINGVIVSFIPTAVNTGAVTISINGGTAYPIVGEGAVGFFPMTAGDIFTGIPTLLFWGGTSIGWINLTIFYFGQYEPLSGTYNLSLIDNFNTIVSTNALTLVLPAASTVANYYYNHLNALNGVISIQPNGTDTINGLNSNFIIPQGCSGFFSTDGNSKWLYSGTILGSSSSFGLIKVDNTSITASAGTISAVAPAAGALTGTTLASNVVNSSLTSVGTIATGTWNGTSISTAKGGTGTSSAASTGVAQVSSGAWSWSTALANGTTATKQSALDNSTKVATTSYVDSAVSAGGLQSSISTTTFSYASSTTLTNITGMTANVSSGLTYTFRACVGYSSISNSGLKIGIGGTATATSFYAAALLYASNALVLNAAATSMGQIFFTTGTIAGQVIIEGSIVVNAGGTLTIQIAQNASQSGTNVVTLGSPFQVFA